MKNTVMRTLATAAAAVVGIAGLAACGDSSDGDNGAGSGDSATAEGAVASESDEFVADLTEGVKIVNDQIAEVGGMTQIMLASDVEQPTQKYGMWVMPFYPSDAVEKYISTIQIDEGNFVVTATSAETGVEWQMDQDGNLAESPSE